MNNSGIDPNAVSISQAASQLYTWTGLRDRDFAFYLGMMRRMIEAAGEPFPESLARSRQTAHDLERSLSQNRLLIVSRMLLPSLEKSMEKAADAQARLQVVRTALALEQYRLKHQGSLPDSLSELVPAFLAKTPADPFDGKPLRYLKRTPGYVVYSIGPDGNDDDGLERGQNNSASRGRGGKGKKAPNVTGRRATSTSYDVTFTVDR
jgi:type II secretory pathway pseudopilin PulG